MSTFFAVLFLISLGFFIWGVAAPAHLSKFANKPLTRKDAGLGFGFIAFILMILTGVTAPKSDIASTSSNQENISKIQSSITEQPKEPAITTKTVTETQSVPFTSTTVNDSSMSKGTSKVTTPGVDGTKTLTYKVTYTNGVQTNKELIKEEVTTQPVQQVTSVGTYVTPTTPAPAVTQSSCDPNYSGGCVPNVYPADVDCGSGSGNGPYYFYGTARVVGVDHYGLDSDHDGLACE